MVKTTNLVKFLLEHAKQRTFKDLYIISRKTYKLKLVCSIAFLFLILLTSPVGNFVLYSSVVLVLKYTKHTHIIEMLVC